MKLQYSHDLPLSKEFAFETLIDPLNLQKMLPGCESFECTGKNSYAFSNKVMFGPIEELYTATLELIDINRPDAIRVIVIADGTVGGVRAEAKVTFKGISNGTKVVVVGEAELKGFLGSLGSAFIEETASNLLEKLFSSLKYKTKIYDK